MVVCYCCHNIEPEIVELGQANYLECKPPELCIMRGKYILLALLLRCLWNENK